MKLSLKSKSINSQVFFNTLGTVVRTGINVISMPIITRLLGAEQYGMAALFSSWLGVLSCFMGLDCISCIASGMYKFKQDYERFKSSVLMFGTFVSIAIILFFLIFIEPISKFMDFPKLVVILLLVGAFATFIVEFVCATWTYEKKALNNVVVSVIYTVISFVCSVAFIYFWQGGREELYVGRVMGLILPQVIIGISLWITFYKAGSAAYVKEYWRYAAMFGGMVLCHHLANRILTQSDRVMMQHMDVSMSSIGVYSFFVGFVGIMATVQNALITAYNPFFYEDLGNANYIQLNSRMKNFVELYATLSVGFLMLSREVMRIFANNEYWIGIDIIPILVIADFFSFSCAFALNYEFYSNKPIYTTLGSILTAITNVILNLIMIPLWGMYGAAIATAISYGLRMIIHMIIVYNWKLQRSPFKKTPIFSGNLFVIVMCILFYVFKSIWVVRWGIGLVLGVSLLWKIYKRRTIF